MVLVPSALSTRVHAQPAAPNRVLKLDGTNSYVELPAHIFTDLTEATVEGWVKWKVFTPWSRVFTFGSLSNSMAFTRELSVMSPGTAKDVFYGIQDTNDIRRDLVVPNVLETNEWFHMAVTSGPEGMQLYLNGTRVAQRLHGKFLVNWSNGQAFHRPLVWLPTALSSPRSALPPAISPWNGIGVLQKADAVTGP